MQAVQLREDMTSHRDDSSALIPPIPGIAEAHGDLGRDTLGQPPPGRVDVDDTLRSAGQTGPTARGPMPSATVAIAGQLPVRTLWHAVPSFPTLSEVWRRLLAAYGL